MIVFVILGLQTTKHAGSNVSKTSFWWFSLTMPEWCNYYICRWSEICIPVGNTRHYFIISQWKSRFNDNPQNIASLIHLKTKSPFWKIRDIVVTYFICAQKQKCQRSFKSVETSNLQALAAVWRKICKSTIRSLQLR